MIWFNANIAVHDLLDHVELSYERDLEMTDP